MPAPRRIRKPMPLRGRRTSWPPDGIGQDYSPNALNVRFRFGEAVGTPGRGILAGFEISEPVLDIEQFAKLDGVTIWPIKLTQSHLYRWGFSFPGVPNQWFNIPGNFVPTGTRRWSYTIGEDHLFFCRGDNTIAQWDGVPGHNFDVITPTNGTVPKARFLEYFNGRLCAFFTTEGANTFANRMRFAQNGDFTKWDDTLGLGAGFLDIQDENQESIRGARGLNGECAVYTRRSIKHVIPTGTLDPTFIVQTRVRGLGCDAPYTIASAGQMHFFLGYDQNVWMWDGLTPTPIGSPVWAEIRALVRPNLMDTYFGKVSTNRGEYWLVLGTDVFIYDYLRGVWSRDSVPSLTALGEVDNTIGALAWNQLLGTWLNGTLTGVTWTQLAGTTMVAFFGGRSDGATMLIDDSISYDYFTIGSIIDRTLETEDMYVGYQEGGADPDAMRVGTALRLLLVYQFVTPDPFEVGISVDRGFSWQTQLVTPNAKGLSYADFNVTGETCRFRFRENNANGRFRWRNYEYEWIDSGEYSGSV